MNKPTIAITGANGFIGSSLVGHFLHLGYPVIALSRNKSIAPQAITKEYNFHTGIHPALLTSADILIHCAFEKNDPVVHGINYSASKQLFEAAGIAGVKKIMFFSSVAAQPYIRSSYGQNKLAIETLLNNNDHVIIKSALVIGRGGLFHRLLDTALTKKYVPLIKSGTQPIQCIALPDVLYAITTIVENELTGTFVLANDERLSYRQFFDTISNVYKKKLRYISIPSSFLLSALRLGALINLSLPISRENVLGMLSQQWVDPSSSLARLRFMPRSLQKSLESINVDDPHY